MKRNLVFFLFLFCFLPVAYGQFAVDMGDQGTRQAGDTTVQAKEPFKLRTYYSALSGKDTLKLGRVFSGAVILPGY